jgi:hypothetical protein
LAKLLAIRNASSSASTLASSLFTIAAFAIVGLRFMALVLLAGCDYSSDWQIEYSQNMPSKPRIDGNGWYFDFPNGTECDDKQNCEGVHYVMRGHNNSAKYGGLLSMTFEIETTGDPKFNYKLEKDNTCEIPAHVRAMLQKRNDDMYERNGRFWANPIAWKLKATNGTVTLNIPLTIENWSNVSGQRDKEGLQRLLANLGRVGITFGGDCFFGHGVNVSGGTARFIMREFGL